VCTIYIDRNVIGLDSCAVSTLISEEVLSAYPFSFGSPPRHSRALSNQKLLPGSAHFREVSEWGVDEERGDEERSDEERGDEERGGEERGDEERGDEERGDEERCDEERSNEERDDEDREVEKQRKFGRRRWKGRIITPVVEQENVFRVTCIREAARSMD
jgi:hypothetical protein